MMQRTSVLRSGIVFECSPLGDVEEVAVENVPHVKSDVAAVSSSLQASNEESVSMCLTVLPFGSDRNTLAPWTAPYIRRMNCHVDMAASGVLSVVPGGDGDGDSDEFSSSTLARV